MTDYKNLINSNKFTYNTDAACTAYNVFSLTHRQLRNSWLEESSKFPALNYDFVLVFMCLTCKYDLSDMT